MNDTTYLYHYGVKGMKWGVRKDKTSSGLIKPKKKSRRQIASEMSDDELNRRISRLNREKQYLDLTAPRYVKAGKRIVEGIIIAAAVTTAKGYVSKYMKSGVTAVEEALKRK